MKILGINDDVTTCECCGKTNLKRTVVLETEDGGELHYGTDCAARALLGKKSSTNSKIVLNRAQAVALAARWIAAGYAPKEVAKGISLRFGYCAEHCRNRNVILIGNFAELPAC